MSVSNLVIKITDALKPVLVKIIPQEYLSRAKKAYMNRNTTKLKDAKIAPYKPGRYAEGNIMPIWKREYMIRLSVMSL